MSDWTHHLKRLENKHAELDKQIDTMEKTGNFGDAAITKMKKERLHIKDEIATLKEKYKDK